VASRLATFGENEMIQPDKLHIPRGSMCLACVHSKRICSKSLDFSKMKRHSETDAYIVVICTGFKKQ
jgi:hypothetical protein